jgi:hypothetical protein
MKVTEEGYNDLRASVLLVSSVLKSPRPVRFSRSMGTYRSMQASVSRRE